MDYISPPAKNKTVITNGGNIHSNRNHPRGGFSRKHVITGKEMGKLESTNEKDKSTTKTTNNTKQKITDRTTYYKMTNGVKRICSDEEFRRPGRTTGPQQKAGKTLLTQLCTL